MWCIHLHCTLSADNCILRQDKGLCEKCETGEKIITEHKPDDKDVLELIRTHARTISRRGYTFGDVVRTFEGESDITDRIIKDLKREFKMTKGFKRNGNKIRRSNSSR